MKWRWPLVAAPIALLIGLVGLYHYTVPMYDEWAMVPFFQKHALGQLRLSDFWQQHVDHRMFFPQLIIYELGRVTRWNIGYEVVVSLVIAVATFALLVHIIDVHFTTPLERALASVAASAILFSPLAWENWLWGWQISAFLPSFGLMLAVASFTGMRRVHRGLRFAFAVIGAVVASYSLGQGLLVWPVCLPVLVLDRSWRRWVPAWTALAAVVVVAYAIGYVRNVSSNGVANYGWAFARYWQTFLARPLSYQGTATGATSLVLVAAVAIAVAGVRRSATSLHAIMPWLVLGMYALSAAALTASGRTELGRAQADASRYTTMSGLLVVALVMLLIRSYTAATPRPLRVASAGAVIVIAALVAMNYADGARQMERNYSENMVVARRCLGTATSASDPCLYATHPEPAAIWPFVQFLRTHNLAGL